jgi:hypothetical protein
MTDLLIGGSAYALACFVGMNRNLTPHIDLPQIPRLGYFPQNDVYYSQFRPII